LDTTNFVDNPLSSADDTVQKAFDTISPVFDQKSDITHNHNLNDLAEKSYNSLDDKPDLTDLHSHSNKAQLDLVTD